MAVSDDDDDDDDDSHVNGNIDVIFYLDFNKCDYIYHIIMAVLCSSVIIS